jgi:hypothetical protein
MQAATSEANTSILTCIITNSSPKFTCFKVQDSSIPLQEMGFGLLPRITSKLKEKFRKEMIFFQQYRAKTTNCLKM